MKRAHSEQNDCVKVYRFRLIPNGGQRWEESIWFKSIMPYPDSSFPVRLKTADCSVIPNGSIRQVIGVGMRNLCVSKELYVDQNL